MIDRLHSYPKVYNLGHPAIASLFEGPVVVQEKVDGSQFTFGVVAGTLHLRSKGATVYPETADKLFKPAVETAIRLFDRGLLVEGFQYRGEAIHAPKHNTLQYERAPLGGFILFDVDEDIEKRMLPGTLKEVAEHLGIEVVPTIFTGYVGDVDTLKSFLAQPSILGGNIEGIVVKNYSRWGEDGKALMGKWVREEFKEIHRANWKDGNPSKGDLVQRITESLKTERRWEKAIEHLRDAGSLEQSPRDIGKLIAEVQRDVADECAAEIKEALWKHAKQGILRGVCGGLAEWYKERLAGQQFSQS